MSVQINDKYQTLFEEPKGIRYYIVNGGRGSGKSYAVNLWANLKTFDGSKILFTRYTLTSAEKSIIPEFKEKIEVLEYENAFDVTKNNIKNKVSNGEIIFSGIKTSSGNQTANLKSIAGISVWILDEAEELTDEETFDKIDLSIRSKINNNIVIMVMNPTTKDHWIYNRFFKNKVADDFNGIFEDTCYINTTYLDNINNLSDSFLDNINKMKSERYDEYVHQILGSWLDNLEGSLFLKEELKYYSLKELTTEPLKKFVFIDVAHQGTDYLCAVLGLIMPNGNVYIQDVVFNQADASVTVPLVQAFINNHNPTTVFVESNGGGHTYMTSVAKGNERVQFVPVKAVSGISKESRIINESYFIKQRFYFRNDYVIGSEYHEFMKNFLQFNKDKKKNKHDDAPDATAGLSQMVYKYSKSLYN